MSRIILLMFLFTVTPSSAHAQMSNSNERLVERYQEARKSAEAGNSPGKVEAAYSALVAVREALTRREGIDGTVLDSLSEKEYQRLIERLQGAIVNRDEVIILNPDPNYFLKLASAHGDNADRAFFGALKATYPESVWPLYLEMHTDVTGCTVFGEGKLVGTYRVWSEFQQQFPKRYVSAAQKEIKDILWRLTDENCTCADAASMQRELEQFLASFPTSSSRAKVAQRLKTIRTEGFNAKSGCIVG
jgi:hypothetical protein